MKAQDLRVGNMISCYGIQFTVDSIDSKYVTHPTKLGLFDLVDCSGVPLTRHWLEKFGIERIIEYTEDGQLATDEWRYYLQGKDVYMSMQYDFSWALEDVSYNQDDMVLSTTKPLKYVHQLQNLIFALTGEELNEAI